MNKFTEEIKKSLSLTSIDSYEITNFQNMYKKARNNNFSILKPLEKSHGIYIFRQKNNKDILYIGCATDQDLRTRIRQHLKEKDTGGTFRINYIEKNKYKFDDFKKYIENNIEIFIIKLTDTSTIKSKETILISKFEPKYNIDIEKTPTK